MTNHEYTLVGNEYHDTDEVPRDYDIFYRCTNCGKIIPSVPDDNIGCDCENVFIDKDYGRLIVRDFNKFEVLRKSASKS
jgi:hypothetical protein